MNRTLIWILGIAAVLVGGFFLLNSYIYNEKQGITAADYKDAEYIIERERVQLDQGVAETEAAPGSASKVLTKYFGNEARHDFNNDGREDVAFLLTQETGGSGTFYYLVTALNTERGYVGSEAVLIGDRITPQTIQVGPGGVVNVNYADRRPGESFSITPSVGKSVWLRFDSQALQFNDVSKEFAGEVESSRGSLITKPWTWISAMYNDGREIKPKRTGVFTITFGQEGRFSATTDCNTMSGSYSLGSDNMISFGEISSTKKFCEGSEEMIFQQLLRDSQGYHFTPGGELVLDLKFDSGLVIFQ